MTEISIENKKELEKLSNKLLEITKDTDILSLFLLSLLSKITNPGYASQFTLVKDPNSNRPNDLLTDETIPVTLYNNFLSFLSFRDTDKKFELERNFLKMITNKTYNIDLAILRNKKECMIF